MENTTHFSRAVKTLGAARRGGSGVCVDIWWLLLELLIGFLLGLLNVPKGKEKYVTFSFFPSFLSVVPWVEFLALPPEQSYVLSSF